MTTDVHTIMTMAINDRSIVIFILLSDIVVSVKILSPKTQEHHVAKKNKISDVNNSTYLNAV